MKSVKSVLGRAVILLLLVLSTSFGFATSPAQAQTSVLDQINQVYSTAKAGGKNAFCAKADLLSAKFSVRSFDGSLCSNSRTIAALSQYVCKNPDVAGFGGSSCDAKGIGRLGGADPLTVLKEEAKSATGVTKDLISKLVPGL